MEIGLSNHLKRVSSELFIKHGCEERKRIDKSIEHILLTLKDHFGREIDDTIVFGSYTRDTILPRRYDQNSDIDILVQFNTEEYEKLKPESYRNQLRRFAQKKYPNSIIIKDHPSIILELHYIKFDLVPSIFDNGVLFDSTEIPDKDGGWMETDPDGFNSKLTEANKNSASIVKPIIRLLKAWNASHDYPYYSYELETEISEMSFYRDNYESGFLHAINNLPSGDLPDRSAKKIDVLRKNGEWLTEYIERGNLDKAKSTLERILFNT